MGCYLLPHPQMLCLWGSQNPEDAGRHTQIMLGCRLSPPEQSYMRHPRSGLRGWVGGAGSAKKSLSLTGGLVSMATN